MRQAGLYEDDEQKALFQWANMAACKLPELSALFAIPNGGYRLKSTAAKLKATGVKAGVPDIFLAVARGGYHGLFVEMKRQDRGTVSKAQKEWIERLTEQGYLAIVCHGWVKAREAIVMYLLGEREAEI